MSHPRPPRAGSVRRLSQYLQGGHTRLSKHRATFPPPPTGTRSQLGLIEMVEAAGMRGRGGAAFPTAVKMRAVVAGKRRPIVVVNGSEGEPASRKDAAMMMFGPHLVLDGALLAAAAVGADEVLVGVDVGIPDARRSIEEALAERRDEHRSHIRIRLEDVPTGYVAGEERSLVRLLNGGPAIPTSGPRPFVRGVRGRPTLVHNVETLGHLALIHAFGPLWFREIGSGEMPGSMLVTVSGAVTRPGIYEIEVGTILGDVIRRAGGVQGIGAVLVGGYAGSWIDPDLLDRVAVAPRDLAALGGIVGAGVIAILPHDACGLSETASVMRWFAGQTAGQCGPCVYGLEAIAGAAEQLASGHGGEATLGRLGRWTDDVWGRGACGLPDGAIRMLRSALQVFGEDLPRHARGRPCAGSRSPRILPVPHERKAA